MDQHNTTNWRILADRFVWSDENAMSSIPAEVSDKEIQVYLYVFHGENITIQEIKKLRAERVKYQ